MNKSILPRAYGLLTIAMLLMATPKPAHAYVDPGSGAMLWQILVAAVIGSLFYVRRVFTWVREHVGFRSTPVTVRSGLDVQSGADHPAEEQRTQSEPVEGRNLEMHGAAKGAD